MAATITVPDEVRDILKRCIITANSVKLPAGQLPRPLYEAFNKVMAAGGGKWNRSAGAHLFQRDPRELLGQVQETGKAVRIQQHLQAFYTPTPLAARMADLANIKLCDRVLEPSAGEGALADEATLNGGSVTCFEIDEHALKVLRSKGYNATLHDFLAVVPSPTYDVVLMNPPFSSGAAVKHTSHALAFLKPGGRLVGLLDAGVLYRSDKATIAFRDRIAELGGQFEKIPAGTFSESGTDVATVLLTVTTPKE